MTWKTACHRPGTQPLWETHDNDKVLGAGGPPCSHISRITDTFQTYAGCGQGKTDNTETLVTSRLPESSSQRVLAASLELNPMHRLLAARGLPGNGAFLQCAKRIHLTKEDRGSKDGCAKGLGGGHETNTGGPLVVEGRKWAGLVGTQEMGPRGVLR